MYDLLTSSILFVILVPGVLLTLPPTGGIMAAIVHAIVFYVVQAYVSIYVPWWAIWVVGIVALYRGFTATPSYSSY